MEVQKITEISNFKKPSVVTVGSFDGVHLGHKKIIDKIVDDAKNEKYNSVLITFDPHPQEIVKSIKNQIYLLTSFKEKKQLLSQTEIDKIIVIPFTKKFSQIEYREFINSYLLQKLNMKKFVIGYDAALGHERKGHLEEIKMHAQKKQYQLDIVPPFKIGNVAVNSTLIRSKLFEGNVAEAAKYLGREYTLSGVVVKGDNRGTKLGYPTANINIENPKVLIPRNGVYAVKVYLNNNKFDAMVNIGIRPTFYSEKNTSRTFEVNIFDFCENLYDQKLKIEFHKFIRDEKQFNNSNELVNQLKKDKIECKKNSVEGGNNES